MFHVFSTTLMVTVMAMAHMPFSPGNTDGHEMSWVFDPGPLLEVKRPGSLTLGFGKTSRDLLVPKNCECMDVISRPFMSAYAASLGVRGSEGEERRNRCVHDPLGSQAQRSTFEIRHTSGIFCHGPCGSSAFALVSTSVHFFLPCIWFSGAMCWLLNK